jgi:hypothetical protein
MRAEQYSKSASMDVRDACALALTRVIQGIDRVIAGEHIKFNHVFDEWPRIEDKYDPPVACVMPPPEWDYSDSGSPNLIEASVESVTTVTTDPPSFGLFKTAEMLDQFVLAIRAGSVAKRSMLKLAIEEAFQTPKITMDPNGTRYGILLDLPEYWSLTARASLLKGANTDSEDAAQRNHREATFVVSIQAPKVQLAPVWPFTPTVTEIMKAPDGSTISTRTITVSNGART